MSSAEKSGSEKIRVGDKLNVNGVAWTVEYVAEAGENARRVAPVKYTLGIRKDTPQASAVHFATMFDNGSVRVGGSVGCM